MYDMFAGDLLTMKQIFSNRGSTIIEIMIALGLVGLVSLGIFSLSQETLKTIQSNQLATTRDQLATEFRQNAGRLRNLKNSLNQPENQTFFNCACGQGSGCDTAKSYTLALYDDAGSTATPKALPLFYDYSGIPCDKTASNCAIEVQISFMAQCKPILPSADPTPPAICAAGAPAEFFSVNFTIQQNSNIPKKKGILFKAVSGSAFTQVANFAPAGSGVCP
jgi:Tfp pilus assembly protein PilV